MEAETVFVSSEIVSKVDLIKVEEGDEVSKDSLLATLENGLLKAKMKQARAALKVAEVNLSIASLPARNEQLKQASSAIKQSKAQKEGALRAYSLAKSMFDKRVSESNAYLAAKSQYLNAEKQKKSLKKFNW